MAFKNVKAKTDDFTYEVVEELGNFGKVDGKGWQWKLRLIKWKGNAEKYDLRQWNVDEDGNEIMRKGITLDGNTIASLTELLVYVRDN